MDMIGFSLPTTSAQVRPSTIIIALLVGTHRVDVRRVIEFEDLQPDAG